MNDEIFDRLTDAVLDGTADAEKRRELERRLRDDPGARDRFEALRSTFSSLRDMPRPEPPADLRTTILATVRSHGIPDRSWRHVWRSLVGGPRLRFAYAFGGFAVGAIATLASTGALVRGGHEGLPVAGSMAPIHSPALAVVDRETLQGPGLSLSVETRRRGQRLALSLRGHADAPARVQVAFDPRQLRLDSTAWPGTEGSLELAEGRATVIADGAISIAMEWNVIARDPAPVRIDLTMNGASRTLRLDVRPESPGTRP